MRKFTPLDWFVRMQGRYIPDSRKLRLLLALPPSIFCVIAPAAAEPDNSPEIIASRSAASEDGWKIPYRAADMALYHAKSGGRDRHVRWQPQSEAA